MQAVVLLAVVCSLIWAAARGEKIAVVGAGSWGTAVAYKLGQNNPASEIALWAFEEVVPGDGRNLTEVINADRVNRVYLPGTTLPACVRASSSLEDVCRDASVVVLVVPHQFLPATLRAMAPHVAPTATALSCIKGLSLAPTGIQLLSDQIQQQLKLHQPCAVLMGANVAADVASDQLVEATVACRSPEVAGRVRALMHSPSLQIQCVDDVFTGEGEGGREGEVYWWAVGSVGIFAARSFPS